MNSRVKTWHPTISLFFSLICITLLAFPLHAKTIGGIKLKDEIKLGDSRLHLNGAGQRTKFFIDLYIAALYLTNKTDNAQTIIDANEQMLLQIHVISSLITSENLTRGTTEGFSKATKNNTAPIQEHIDSFLEAFKEPIQYGDIFEIVYQTGKGITVLKNRHIAKRLPENFAFKQALFGIWLSDNPAQKSLKEGLLGK